MNTFEEAIAAHEEWKTTFEHTVRAGGGDLRPDLVREDNHCLLGLWLHGEGSKSELNPRASAMLRDVHAEFHRAAAQVLTLALAGRTREAIHAMGPGTQYDEWSAMLVVALQRYGDAARTNEFPVEMSGPAA